MIRLDPIITMRLWEASCATQERVRFVQRMSAGSWADPFDKVGSAAVTRIMS